MEVNIVERRDNPLLSREEVRLEIKSESTPSRTEVRNYVSASLGADPSLTVVKKIWGRAGDRTFYAEVFIYKDERVMRAVEPKYILIRNGVMEDGKAQSQ